jgi:predicted nucleic-acid-binding protein
MIALDTNVLLRFLLADDPTQTPKAIRLVAEASERGEAVWLSLIVLCETEWVLESAYKVDRQHIYAILKRLLRSDPFRLEEAERVESCLESYRKGKGDLSDFLLGEVSRAAGASTTYTFDRDLRREPGFTLL